MVARSESMFGCYDSYSYRLWSLANVWNTCQPSPLTNGTIKEEDLTSPVNPEYCIKCPQCQKGMQTFQALKEHVECCHMDLSMEPVGLTAPSAISPSPTLIGTAGGPFGCSQCTTTFSSKDQLEKHELLHSPNAQVSCKVCNKTFANVYRLQRHMISHDESAVLRKFKCTECEKAFKFKHHLKEHIRIHSGEKPFECGNCGKRFSHSGSYSSHMTSKKCLVMNVKLGRTRAPSSSALLDKNTQQNLRGPKRPNISPINNNVATSPNHNSYLSILPKYPEAAVAFLQNSGIPPCFIGPPSLLNAHTMTSYSMPSLSHILEQLQQQHHQQQQQQQQQQQHQQSPIRPSSFMDTCDSSRQTETNPNFDNSSNHSDNNELIMDEDVDTEVETKPNCENQSNTTGDLEAVKRILETVNATVTKELLQANMQKMSSDTSSECPSVVSVHSPKPTQVEQQECTEDVKSEGLAAKLEGAFPTTKSEEAQNGSISGEDQDYERNYNTNDEMDSESFTTTDHVSEDGRKVRVRSLISDEQLKVLKDHYKVNPRPKREDLEKIASRLNFSVRVVQVWFQNTRARDRREGKLIQVPYSPLPSSPRYSLSSKPQMNMSPNQYISEQPLDLSIKREVSAESSPSSSPIRPSSETHEEVVNLSRKNSPPYLPFLNHYQNSNSSEPRRSPSPLEFNSSRLAQILAQPANKIGLSGMGLVPMDQLMQFRGTDLPSLSQLISNRISNMSPSEKKAWAEGRELSNDVAEDELSNASRSKMSQFVFKSLGSPVLSNQDVEAEGQFTCNQCDKAFSKQSSLARHKYEHSGQRPHKCDQCTKAFKHKHHLTEHKRLHSGEKPFQCGKCMKRFSHSGSYSQHMNHRYSYCKPYRE